MPENRIDALLNSEQHAEDDAIAKLTRLQDVYGAESRAAEVVADKVMRGRYRYNPGLGWLEWNGRYWDSDPVAGDRLIDTVRQYADTVEREYRAKAAGAEPARRALLARVVERVPVERRTTNQGRVRSDAELFGMHSTEAERTEMAGLAGAGEQAEIWLNLLSSGKINAVIKLCRGMEGIVTRVSELDAHPDLINCANGVLDLRTGQLSQPDPDLLFTHAAGGGYDPAVHSPLLEQALEAIPPGAREWYQIRLGQAATGHTPDDDSMLLEQGEGENGKTVVVLAAMRALGGYARMISHRVLTGSSDQHPTELMDLRGLRLAILEETPEEGRLDPHRIKTTIGTGHITARLMRKDDVTFETSHSLIVTSNYWPQVDTTDHGTWRKLKGMVWPVRYLPPGVAPTQDHERVGDRSIKSRVRTDPDLPTAMLTWIAEGARKWYANGQVAPEDPQLITDATEEWRKSCDVGYQFAADYLLAAPDHYITGTAMKAEFDAFLTSQGKKKWSSQLFNTRAASSMLAAGIRVDTNPRTPVPVGVLIESLPGLPKGTGKSDPSPTRMARMWRGVRFRDEVAGATGAVLGTGGRGHLAVVTDRRANR
jgi:P4 family phage/plasmid primase-like protien